MATPSQGRCRNTVFHTRFAPHLWCLVNSGLLGADSANGIYSCRLCLRLAEDAGMSTLSDISRIVVPHAAAVEAWDHLRRVGQRGSEGFALWAGTQEGDAFQVLRTRIPDQQGLRLDSGVCVRVGSDEMHR